jgi:hypothetical protein
MPKKETPGVVRQDGTRGGGHFIQQFTHSRPRIQKTNRFWLGRKKRIKNQLSETARCRRAVEF